MMGRFHTICDCCNSRGPEYQAHTVSCRECLRDTCENCAAEFDMESQRGICRPCREVEVAASAADMAYDMRREGL